MELGIALLIAGSLAVFVMAPLLARGTEAGEVVPVDVTMAMHLKRRRLVVYENLQDLEFEYKSGKIAAQDYEGLRTNYRAEAAGLMAASLEAESADAADTLIEREVATRRAERRQKAPEDYTCPKCGFENPLPVKFCGECGAALAAARKKTG
jgi:DNA-directed RNA polymerase subunit M/transcription elongation factor TFIIS